MRFERGPFGRIAVRTVASESDVILHALDVLQNHIIPSILPVYLREQMGQVQLCIDCTGYVVLSEVKTKDWSDEKEKRACISMFLKAIIDAQDHFIDPESFVMNPDYVFWDPADKKLYWYCLPLVQQQINLTHDNSARTWQNLEQLLLDPFFSDLIAEDDRNQIICLFRDAREDDLLAFLADFAASEPILTKQKKHIGIRAICLGIQFLFMSVCFAVCIYIERKQADFFAESEWASWFVLIFTFLLITILIAGHDKRPETSQRGNRNRSETNQFLTKKEIYFPTSKKAVGVYSTDSPKAQFSPAFLTQQVTSPSQDKKAQRAVVWVDDFLIGRDKCLCDLFIDHPSVSDRHARILHRGPMYFLLDQGSAKGTYIDSRRLYSFEETPLNDGDVIVCGEMRFVFSRTE